MKLNYRIVIINFIVVLLVLLATAIIYYSILSESLISLQKKNLSASLNSFSSAIQNFSQQMDNSFYHYYKKKNKIDEREISKLDFIFYSEQDSLISIFLSENFKPYSERLTKEELNSYHSNLYLKKVQMDSKVFYYGKMIDANFLNSIAQKINADIVLISDKSVIEVSNQQDNQEFFFVFLNAIRELSNTSKNNVFSEESNSANVLATIYKPFDLDNSVSEISFLVFNKLSEYTQLKTSLKNILIVIGISGLALSVLLSYLFTTKIRQQIKQLSSATEFIKDGDFNVKVNIKGNNELAYLGETFNLMVDRLRSNQKILSDYSDFITLLNQKSSLKEIAELALNKIISTTKFSIGAIYLVENGNVNLIASEGISTDLSSINNKTILNHILEKKNKLILNFDSNIPSIRTGLVEIKLNHLILQPIIYSENVVAILELVSQHQFDDEIIDYLEKIQEQLAIGLINAKSVQQLQDYVTELKNLNEELKNSNLQIVKQNEMLIRLSEELQNQAKELSVQKERAEESTKLKSQFLARISHELKTPLNSIIGLTELIISKSEVDDKDKERLKVIQRSGKRLIDLINNLLDYSQIESGKFKLEYSEFQLDDFVNDIIYEIEPLANQKNLKLITNKKFETNLKIFSDKEKLHQVIINILGNAVKFTHEGFIEFTIINENQNIIEFGILDTGIGIDKSANQLIFEEFRQVDGSTSRKYEGSGLGLSISKKIVEMLGGNIWFESNLNKGTKFYVQIPLKSFQSSLQNPSDIKKFISNQSANDNLILVVDDDADSLFTLTEILNTYGFKTSTAISGVECLKILENTSPNLILLDIMMPEMDGFQTIKNIRALEKFKLLKIFAVTAKAMENAKDVIQNSGFDDCVFKPVNPNELIEKILKHLHINIINEYEKNLDNR